VSRAPLEELAAALAGSAPAEAVLASSGNAEIAQGFYVQRLSWLHEVEGIPVAGDRREVLLDASRKVLVGYAQRWRTITPVTPEITAATAARLATAQRFLLNFDEELEQGEPWLQYVGLAAEFGGGDRLVWVVPFSDSAGLIELFIDAVRGTYVGSRSRR
jgi:hypothetical protein